MTDERTVVRAPPLATDDTAVSGPCPACGLRNPPGRRACLACGHPVLGTDETAGELPTDVPLLERAAETAAIDAVIAAWRASGKGAFVRIDGPGTTRLLRHAAERLLEAGDSVRLLATSVRPADGPLAPITRLLWDRFGVSPSRSRQSVRSELLTDVGRAFLSRAQLPTEHARRIVSLAGLGADEHQRPDVPGEAEIARWSSTLARFLEIDATLKPTAMLIDGVHASGVEGAALLRAIVRDVVPTAPLLVFAAGHASALDADATLHIEPLPLTPEGAAELSRSLLPGVPEVPEDLVHAVVTRAGGHPGRLREILRALIESRVVVADEVPWRVDLDALGPHAPISTADLLPIRWSKLDDDARALLGRAAVVGEVFWEGAVDAIARIEHSTAADGATPLVRARETLRKLVHGGWIVPADRREFAGERAYAFAAPGARDLALASVPDERQRLRHDVCASWLELAAGTQHDEVAFTIADHLAAAGLGTAAAHAYLRAARAARTALRTVHAVECFDRALALLAPNDAPARIGALHDRGGILNLLGRTGDAEQSFREMLALAERYGARNKMAAALDRLGRIERNRGSYERASEAFERARDLYEQVGDQRGLASVRDDLGVLAYHGGDFEAALEHSTRALEMRRQLEDPLGEALSTHNLGLVHFARGQPRQARAYFERALALRERHGDMEGAAITRNVLAAMALDRGDTAQAERMWTDIVATAEALGDKRMVAYASCNLAEGAIRSGDASLAQQRLDAAERLARELDDPRVLVEVDRLRGTLCIAANEHLRARPHLERAIDSARALGLREAEARALRDLGEAAANERDTDASIRRARASWHFTSAIELLEQLGAVRELARTRASYGLHLAATGDVTSARDILVTVIPVLERLELWEAQSARAALAQLSPETP